MNDESTLLFLRGRKYPAKSNIIGKRRDTFSFVNIVTMSNMIIKMIPKAYQKIDRSDDALSASFSSHIGV
jgi:hypothetical protein